MKKRLLWIAATALAAGFAGWMALNGIWPSAPRLLRMAAREAESGDFRNAMGLLGRASTARGHASCAVRCKEFGHNLRDWQITVVAWEFAQDALENGQWRDAREALSQTIRWDWNTDDALRHQRRAQATERLLEAFLAMREAMASPDSASVELQENLSAWQDALALAEAESAMADEVWHISFDTLFPQGAILCTMEADSIHRNVWMPLKEAGTAIAEEIAAALEEYAYFRECLAELEKPDIRILSRPAADCRGEIAKLHAATLKRKETQTADWKAKKYKTLRYSPLLENQCTRIWDALDDLSAAERTVVGNLETIAALEFGWDRSLETDLPFPHHTDDPALLAYRKTLTDANRRLCTQVAPRLKNTHLAALAEMEMEEPGQVPVAIEWVTQPWVPDEIRRFVDWRSEAPRTWGGGTVVDGCAYDEILGCEYVCDFLDSADENRFGGEDFLAENSPGKLKDGGEPCPLARQAREDFNLLERFVDFIAHEPLLEAASTWKRLENGKKNSLGAFRQKTQELLDHRKDYLAELLPATKASGRDGVAAKVLYLMLETDRWSDNERELHKAAHDEYHRLFNAHVTQAREERRGNAVYLDKCVPDAFWFREWREWADSHAAGGGK